MEIVLNIALSFTVFVLLFMILHVANGRKDSSPIAVIGGLFALGALASYVIYALMLIWM